MSAPVVRTMRRRRSVADETVDEPCSSSSLANKRARYSSESAEQVRPLTTDGRVTDVAHDESARQVPLFRHSQRVLRPGIPPCIQIEGIRFPDRPSPPYRADDKEGHYVYELGENISSRYKILGKFGEGTFGRVLECWDRHTREYVAVKIVRNVDKYRHAAMIELEVLNTLEKNDPELKRHCVKLKEWFDYRNHVCMVFEKLGPSLFDFLRRNDYQPFPLAFVQAVGRQLLEAVAYMHELNLVHTDLKPENILLLDDSFLQVAAVPGSTGRPRYLPARSVVRVIDFGSATFDDAYHSSVVSTRHYRAPEVILGLGWSFPCDLWSMGCILVELASGDALFQTHENMEHLAMMERVLGPLPREMGRRAEKGVARLFVDGALAWPAQASSQKSKRVVGRLQELGGLLRERVDPADAAAVDVLVDLVRGMLRYEPHLRTSAAEALRHDFFKLQLHMPEGEPPPQPQQPLPAVAAAAAAVAAAAAAQQQELFAAAIAHQQQQQQAGLVLAPAALQQQQQQQFQPALQTCMEHQLLIQQQQQLQHVAAAAAAAGAPTAACNGGAELLLEAARQDAAAGQQAVLGA